MGWNPGDLTGRPDPWLQRKEGAELTVSPTLLMATFWAQEQLLWTRPHKPHHKASTWRERSFPPREGLLEAPQQKARRGDGRGLTSVPPLLPL